MKKILILLGLLIWVGTVYGQSGVIRRTQTALVDTLATHIIKANWDTYISGGGFSDPMTTRGDVIYRNSSNITDRLAVGSSTYVLTSDGVDVSWSAPVGGTPTRQTLLTNDATLDFTTASGTWAEIDGMQQNTVLTFTVAPDFTEGRIRVTQDGTGGWTFTIAETVAAITAIEYDGGFELIQPTASTTTYIKYEVDEATLRISIEWYE